MAPSIFNEHSLTVTRTSLGADRKTVLVEIAGLQPTWCMEIKCSLRGADGKEFTRTIHNTIHQLGTQ